MKLRVYACSIMAFGQVADQDGTGPKSFIEHTAVLFLEESYEAAAEQCKARAFERWPVEQGWYNHHATIAYLGDDFFSRMTDSIMEERYSYEPEEIPERTFQLS